MGAVPEDRVRSGWRARWAAFGRRRARPGPDLADLGTDAALELCLSQRAASVPTASMACLAMAEGRGEFSRAIVHRNGPDSTPASALAPAGLGLAVVIAKP